MDSIELITARLARAWNENLGVPTEDVKMGASMFEDLNLDSLDNVEVAMVTEDEFGITIEDASAEACLTVQDYVLMVEEKLRKKVV